MQKSNISGYCIVYISTGAETRVLVQFGGANAKTPIIFPTTECDQKCSPWFCKDMWAFYTMIED